jgi:hypothetical protein
MLLLRHQIVDDYQNPDNQSLHVCAVYHRMDRPPPCLVEWRVIHLPSIVRYMRSTRRIRGTLGCSRRYPAWNIPRTRTRWGMGMRMGRWRQQRPQPRGPRPRPCQLFRSSRARPPHPSAGAHRPRAWVSRSANRANRRGFANEPSTNRM